MKALFLMVPLIWACGSSASTGDDSTGVDAHASNDQTSGWKLGLGQNYESAKPVTIGPSTTSGGVYNGYFEASSDLSSVPNISVSLSVANAQLSAGQTLACARSHDDSRPANETSVLIHWLDGDTYYSNVMATQNCSIHITAASQTTVSADISGTIYDEMDPNLAASNFTASFVATVRN